MALVMFWQQTDVLLQSFFFLFAVVSLATLIFIYVRHQRGGLAATLRTRRRVSTGKRISQPSGNLEKKGRGREGASKKSPKPGKNGQAKTNKSPFRPNGATRSGKPPLPNETANAAQIQSATVTPDQHPTEEIPPDTNSDVVEDDTGSNGAAKDEVEFLALAPNPVPPARTFRVHVNIQKLPENMASPSSEMASFETLVAEVQRGARVGLVLEAGDTRTIAGVSAKRERLLVDAPYQALTWSGRNLVADFVVHSPSLQKRRRRVRVQSTLWITCGRIGVVEIPKGKINIEIDVDANLADVSELIEYRPDHSQVLTHKQMNSRIKLANLAGVGQNAALFETSLITYAHADRKVVGNFIRALSASYRNPYVDVLDMDRGPNWLVQIAAQIEDSDIIFLFWSKAAAASPSIREELDLIEVEMERRRQANIAELAVCVVEIEETPTPPPSWLRKMSMGSSRRTEAFESFYMNNDLT